MSNLLKIYSTFQTGNDPVANAEKINRMFVDGVGRGMQVLVGHYNGNLPAEHLANLTKGIRFKSKKKLIGIVCRGTKREQFRTGARLWRKWKSGEFADQVGARVGEDVRH